MKILIIVDIVVTAILYVFFSMYNHTWDIMAFTQDTVSSFGISAFSFYLISFMYKVMVVDSPKFGFLD